MKNVATSLSRHLNQGQTTLAYLWKVTRKDGTVVAFTSHDEDLVFNGTTYLASSGFSNTATANKSDLSVDNLEVVGFLESDALAEADLRAGLYDSSDVEIRIVNWASPGAGSILLRKGTIGIVKLINGIFTAEIRGLSDKLSTVLGATFGPICRAVFGSGLNGIDLDSKYLCKVDVVALTQTGTLTAAPDAVTLTPAGGLTGAAGYFDDGLITFTSGALAGFPFEVKSWDGTNLGLFLPMPSPPAPGDTFTIEPGCNHLTSDCKTKFNNLVNFRGEPFIPGMDAILNYPNATG
jgi:uncharacterized phage protein (TIGR02218 family)